MDNTQTHKDPSRVPDEPTIKESTWLGLAIALVIITFVLFSMAAFWVALAQNSEDMVRRAQTFTPFGAVLFAMVTFCTVAWRGLVTTRQADLQTKQIEQQIRQNDTKDEENLAKLLMDGTKLISDGDEKKANVLAGIAALQAVITSPNSRFAIQAIDLLGDLLSKEFPKGNSMILQKCIETLKSGVVKGRFSEGDLELKTRMYLFKQTEDSEYANDSGFDFTDDFKLKMVGGFSSIRYFGGIFNEVEYHGMNDSIYYFEDVEFRKCKIIESYNYSICIFEKCFINNGNNNFLSENRFYECDFSGFILSNKEGDYLDVLKTVQKKRSFVDCFY